MGDGKSWVIIMGVFILGTFAFIFTFMGWNSQITGHVVSGGSSVINGTSGGEDVYVDKSTANRNHGDKDQLKVQKIAWQRSYLSFNISSIPTGQIIDNASLCLFLDNDQGDQNISINHVFDDDWCEGDGGTDASPACEITWNNQPCGTDENVINGSCNSTVEDVLITDTSLDGTWACFNISEMVSNDYPNDEVSMVLWTTDAGSADIFASKEDANISRWPYLEVNYHAANTAPVINIALPQDESNYDYNESLTLNFSLFDNDDNIDSCWYNIDNGSNVSLSSCENTSFDVSGNGDYVLMVYANDSFGEESSDSVNFNVDLDGISVEITEPTGEKSSRTGIILVYSALGADDCWYNVKTSIGGDVIGNTSLTNCSGSNFDVSVDGDYVVNVFANNTLGSLGSDNSGFSVDTSEDVVIPPSSGGGGSGGGGGSSSFFISSLTDLEIEDIMVIASIGEDKSLSANVKNTDRVSANKCSLVTNDGFEEYIDSNDLLNIGVGEIVEFMFLLSVLDDDVVNLELSIECLDNISTKVPFEIVLLESKLDVSIVEVSFVSGNELFVAYDIEPTDSSTHSLSFKVLNSDGNVLTEIEEDVELVFGELYSSDILLDLSDVDEGMLKIAIADDEELSLVEETFVYGGSVGVTGFASFDLGADFSYIGITLFVFLILASVLTVRIFKLKKCKKKSKKKKK